MNHKQYPHKAFGLQRCETLLYRFDLGVYCPYPGNTYAWRRPRPGHEAALVHALKALAAFADAHVAAYGSPIADDGVLGPAWLDMASGMIEVVR